MTKRANKTMEVRGIAPDGTRLTPACTSSDVGEILSEPDQREGELISSWNLKFSISA